MKKPSGTTRQALDFFVFPADDPREKVIFLIGLNFLPHCLRRAVKIRNFFPGFSGFVPRNLGGSAYLPCRCSRGRTLR